MHGFRDGVGEHQHDRMFGGFDMSEDERLKTYIEGFDKILEGGIPRGHIVLVTGTPGTMKSSLSYYILYNQ